jgi:hypothetical protein
VAVAIAMNVFSGNLKALVNATYVEQNRKGKLGVIKGAEHRVQVFIDEGYRTNWQSTEQSQTYDVLIYAKPTGVLKDKTCEGGLIKTSTRTFRIESFHPSMNQRTGKLDHIELGCGEV